MKSLPYRVIDELFTQPVDHENPGETFEQRVRILIPETINDFTEVPVLFVLGNESSIDANPDSIYYDAYKAEIIYIVTEHRGYGHSITNGDQSIPSYVTIKQALADFHEVVNQYKKTYTGPWVGAGYSYGGGLVINYAHSYPNDLEVILSSSGVVDWSFLMDTYDKQVRINLGDKLYRGLLRHVNNLRPDEPFDQNWLDRELIIAFVTGFSQMTLFDRYFPIFRFLSKLSTKRFIKVLRWLDRKIAQNGASNYIESNSKLTLSHEEAKSGKYSWRVWRYQQFFETGVFWQSEGGIYQRSKEDLSEECKILFGTEPPLLKGEIWDPKAMVNSLKIPMIYVNGGADPWSGVCLEKEYTINGKYLYYEHERHCPDFKPELGAEVWVEILNVLSRQKKKKYI